MTRTAAGAVLSFVLASPCFPADAAGQEPDILGTFREGITELDPTDGQKLTAKYDYVTFTVRSPG